MTFVHAFASSMLLVENAMLCLAAVLGLIWQVGTQSVMVAALAVHSPSPPTLIYCMVALTVIYNMEKDLCRTGAACSPGQGRHQHAPRWVQRVGAAIDYPHDERSQGLGPHTMLVA